MKIEHLRPFFDEIDITPKDWPVHCNFVVPNRNGLDTWPEFPPAALPSAGRAGSGRGRDAYSCLLCGLYEAIEIASTCHWGDEALILASANNLGMTAVEPDVLNGFSKSQHKDRQAWNSRMSGMDWIPPHISGDTPLHWLAAQDAFSDSKVWLPADFVLIGRRNDPDQAALAFADTNGCAAGVSDTDAKLRAILELIERDATGRWWYGIRAREPFATETLLAYGEKIHRWFVDQERLCKVLDITTDVGIPVAVAISAHPRTGSISLGFSANISASKAASNALVELAQMTILTEAAALTGQMRPAVKRWVDCVNDQTPPVSFSDYSASVAPNEAGSNHLPSKQSIEKLDHCLDALNAARCRVFFLDCTRPEFGIPVWRAVSPELCHWKPRLGRSRLLQPDANDKPSGSNSRIPNEVLLSI